MLSKIKLTGQWNLEMESVPQFDLVKLAASPTLFWCNLWPYCSDWLVTQTEINWDHYFLSLEQHLSIYFLIWNTDLESFQIGNTLPFHWSHRHHCEEQIRKIWSHMISSLIAISTSKHKSTTKASNPPSKCCKTNGLNFDEISYLMGFGTMLE